MALIVSYIFIFTLCLITVYVSFKLYEKYRQKFLYFYLCYIIAHYILGFFYLFGAFLNHQLLLFSYESKNLVTEILGFLIFPFIPIMLFMYMNFLTDLLHKKLPKYVRRFFFGFWGIVVFVYMFVAVRFFVTRDDSLLKEIRAGTYVLEGMILLAATFFFLMKARTIMLKSRRKAMLTIGLIYLSIFVFYAVSFLRVIHLTLYFFLFLHFGFNIPPLIFLGIYLKKNHPEVSVPRIEAENLDSFFREYHMTQREGEVFLLILKGKRTKDIEKELFISYHTAKNHTHNIFQKLNVKNRLQAIDLLRNYLDNSRS